MRRPFVTTDQPLASVDAESPDADESAARGLLWGLGLLGGDALGLATGGPLVGIVLAGVAGGVGGGKFVGEVVGLQLGCW